jgi:glycerol-3-phosphate dehydrogenase (NAD(P)+)
MQDTHKTQEKNIMSHRITVIGDGGWGTALALVLHRNGHQVTIWGHDTDYINEVAARRENFRYLPGVPMPEGLNWSSNRDAVSATTDAFVIAVPSKFYKATLESFHGLIPPHASMISVSKGLLDDRRLSDWASELLDLSHVAALSGPSHAEEVVHEAPTAVTIASTDPDLANFFQELFNSPRFRVYTASDIVGVELGGALKNVIAIAAGISDGLGFGDNTKAALVTRGLAELVRLGTAAGGDPGTFVGLSGVGDLMVTCGSRHSRNRGVGERLGKGETMEQIEADMTMIAEGVFNAKTARELAQHLKVSAPITEEVYRIIYEGKSPAESMDDLLSRDPKPESVIE